jgi:hypothetical protein
MPWSMKLVPSAMAVAFIALIFMLLPPLLLHTHCCHVHGGRNINMMAMKTAAIVDFASFVDHGIQQGILAVAYNEFG